MISHDKPLVAAFEFTSLPMLGWLVAAALPWLIHRWFRRQHQTTPWAAVELLLSAMQQRSRRIQMQQWLLLAVRTAILAMVALAIAEPTLRQWAVGAVGSQQVHRIVVVDQSYSMGCVQSEVSRWQLAQQSARRWIENSEGDAISLIGWGDQAENFLGRPTFEASKAVGVLDDLQVSQSSAQLSTVLASILATIDRAESELPQLASHHVVFCTDLSRQTWQTGEKSRSLLERVSQRASIKLVDVGIGPSNNLALTDLRIDPVVTLRQRESTILATVAVFGKPLDENVVVELTIDGREVDRKQIKLSEDRKTIVQFSHRFLDEGVQTVQVRFVDHQDCLASDDQRLLIADVHPRLRVACFAGQPDTVSDLSRALAPGGESGENDGAIDSQIISANRLGELELSDYDVVVLGSGIELSLREAATLTEYVRQGGGLAVFLGEQSANEWGVNLQQLLPIRIEGTQPAGEYRFDPLEYRHPIVSPFRGQTQSGLLGVAVAQYRRLQIDKEHLSTEVVLRFNTGDPALVVDDFGLGRVAVSALPCSLSARTAIGGPWSSFALSPIFLPVVRELVTHLVGDGWLQQRNLQVGEAAVFPWAIAARQASVRLPDGTRQTLPLPAAEDKGQMVFRATDQCGVYSFEADGKECARFAVHLDGKDSDLTSIDPTTLPTGFSEEPVERALVLSKAGGDISFVRTLLAATVGLLLLEIGLAYQLGKGWG